MIDLRSDFISRPTAAMRHAMSAVAEQPFAFGLREDPMERRLEEKASELFGTDDALFCATCTMANQIAIHLACRRGDAVAAIADAHIFTSEAGSMAALTGAMPRPVQGRQGRMALADVEAAITQGDPQRSRTALVVVENTHVRSGGTVVPMEEMRAIGAAARKAGVPVHLDGSRLFNAAAALGVRASDLASTADTISVNMNKGLAAPLGAILAGSKETIREAVRIRQLFGGSWRPAGIPAAAALVALETMVDRIADDHATARALATNLAELDGIRIDPEQVQTNIILVHLERPDITLEAFLAGLEGEGVRAVAFGARTIRLVTYWEIGPAEVIAVTQAFAAALRKNQP